MAGTPNVTKAGKLFAHPLRVQLWRKFIGKELSPSMLATKTGQPLGNVAYHIRVLLDAGVIEKTQERPVRGAVEHFYRAKFTPMDIYRAVMKEAIKKR